MLQAALTSCRLLLSLLHLTGRQAGRSNANTKSTTGARNSRGWSRRQSQNSSSYLCVLVSPHACLSACFVCLLLVSVWSRFGACLLSVWSVVLWSSVSSGPWSVYPPVTVVLVWSVSGLCLVSVRSLVCSGPCVSGSVRSLPISVRSLPPLSLVFFQEIFGATATAVTPTLTTTMPTSNNPPTQPISQPANHPSNQASSNQQNRYNSQQANQTLTSISNQPAKQSTE